MGRLNILQERQRDAEQRMKERRGRAHATSARMAMGKRAKRPQNRLA